MGFWKPFDAQAHGGMMDDWLKRYRVRSTIILAIASVMMWRSAEFSMWFAVGNERDGAGIAMILAAIQAPAAFFAGWAFKIYSETKIP